MTTQTLNALHPRSSGRKESLAQEASTGKQAGRQAGWFHGNLKGQVDPASPTTTKGSGKVRTTQEVLDHHLKAFGAGNLEDTLSDYAPDAIMFTPDGPLKGNAAMTPTYKAFFAEFGKPGLKVDMKKQIVEGDYAYIYWGADTADNLYEGAQDAFVVKNGKIVAHFFSAMITPKH